MKWVAGNAVLWGAFDARAADLLITESDPRSPLELLPDWERAFGLPDPCSIETPTIADRRAALINRMTIVGRQDRNFFISLAAAIGYTITIRRVLALHVRDSRNAATRARSRRTIPATSDTVGRSGRPRCGSTGRSASLAGG